MKNEKRKIELKTKNVKCTKSNFDSIFSSVLLESMTCSTANYDLRQSLTGQRIDHEITIISHSVETCFCVTDRSQSLCAAKKKFFSGKILEAKKRRTFFHDNQNLLSDLIDQNMNLVSLCFRFGIYIEMYPFFQRHVIFNIQIPQNTIRNGKL